ncbi:MAG: hypothetical protein U9P10_11695, partial [Thermodesulfobacteriota bacterium]|nr:hypothetical protein [Thermodesulfobacteriota bacterium]
HVKSSTQIPKKPRNNLRDEKRKKLGILHFPLYTILRQLPIFQDSCLKKCKLLLAGYEKYRQNQPPNKNYKKNTFIGDIFKFLPSPEFSSYTSFKTIVHNK